MLGVVLSAAWDVLSAHDFAIPRWVFHQLADLFASTGSA